MKYISLAWDVLKGLGKLLMFWRIHKAGEEKAELNELEKDLEAQRRAANIRDRHRTDSDYRKRMWSHFER